MARSSACSAARNGRKVERRVMSSQEQNKSEKTQGCKRRDRRFHGGWCVEKIFRTGMPSAVRQKNQINRK